MQPDSGNQRRSSMMVFATKTVPGPIIIKCKDYLLDQLRTNHDFIKIDRLKCERERFFRINWKRFQEIERDSYK